MYKKLIKLSVCTFFNKAHHFSYTPRVTINSKDFLVSEEFLLLFMSQNLMTPEMLWRWVAANRKKLPTVTTS